MPFFPFSDNMRPPAQIPVAERYRKGSYNLVKRSRAINILCLLSLVRATAERTRNRASL